MRHIDYYYRDYTSTVSIYELLRAIARDRLQLNPSPDEWLEKATRGVDVAVLPVTADIAATAARLPAIHGDPLDRLIIATALCHQSQLASLDINFNKYPELEGFLLF
jgi:PIN domain nuclease of toxin-antitoxin system